MYLTKDANTATLRQIASFAAGSTLAMTFLLPMSLLEVTDRGYGWRRTAPEHPGRLSSASSLHLT